MIKLARIPLFIGLLTCVSACEEGQVASLAIESVSPVIWVNSENPAKSWSVGADIKGGLMVNDLSGTLVGQFGDGNVSDIDVRGSILVTTADGSPASAVSLIVVAATNRTDKTIMVAALNAESGALSPILVEPIPSNFDNPQALCFYKSAVNDNLYIFAADVDGTISQWLLYDSGLGTLRHTIMRTWSVGEPIIDCTADDQGGSVEVTVAGGAAWRYGAEPKDSFADRDKVN